MLSLSSREHGIPRLRSLKDLRPVLSLFPPSSLRRRPGSPKLIARVLYRPTWKDLLTGRVGLDKAVVFQDEGEDVRVGGGVGGGLWVNEEGGVRKPKRCRIM